MYCVDATVNGDLCRAPTVARFSIDRDCAAQILSLAAVVKEHGLLKVHKIDYRAEFLQFDPYEDPVQAAAAGEANVARTEVDCVVVRRDSFQFTAYIEHTSLVVSSDTQQLAELAAHFGLPWVQ